MSEHTKAVAWWEKWGPWVGPTSIVALLALMTRLDACAYSPSAIRSLAENNQTRIEALEAIQRAQQSVMSEHLKVAEARMQMQDNEKLKLALTEQALHQQGRDIDEIKSKVNLLVEAAMRKGEIRR